MKKIITSLVTAVAMILAAFLLSLSFSGGSDTALKVGYLYVSDASTPYTFNFMKAQESIEAAYGSRTESLVRCNVSEGEELPVLEEMVAEGCDIIFGTSYGYGPTMKSLAEKYPAVQFITATGDTANEAPVLSNYHTFMGHVYEGRYLSGVIAGMKLRELIDSGQLQPEQAVIGYVAAFPYAEVISGYTAFFLGVRSEVPEATMNVRYTNTWSDYAEEKRVAEAFIDEGCVIIAQHSDTAGPAVACENATKEKIVYHVSYNRTMMDLAPTTSLVGCRINWGPYMLQAVDALLQEKPIEKNVRASVNGQDCGAGFDQGWVQLLELNQAIAPAGAQEKITAIEKQFRHHNLTVFKGDYIGVDSFDPSDTYDLSQGFKENQHSSAPAFHYILQDVIHVLN